MKAEKTAIRILAVTAMLLVVAIIVVPSAVTGQVVTTKGGDYLIATHKTAGGGDALYITDTRIGVMGVFTWDPMVRGLVLRTVRPLPDAFGGR